MRWRSGPKRRVERPSRRHSRTVYREKWSIFVEIWVTLKWIHVHFLLGPLERRNRKLNTLIFFQGEATHVLWWYDFITVRTFQRKVADLLDNELFVRVGWHSIWNNQWLSQRLRHVEKEDTWVKTYHFFGRIYLFYVICGNNSFSDEERGILTQLKYV